MSMSDDRDAMVEERLSVFDDEPDLNDWVEVMCGAAMVVLGVFHLVEPGTSWTLISCGGLLLRSSPLVQFGPDTASRTWP